MRVGFFSYALFVLYLPFGPPETIERGLERVRKGLARRAERRDAHGVVPVPNTVDAGAPRPA